VRYAMERKAMHGSAE